MQFANRDVLQIRHLQHVGCKEDSLQDLNICCLHAAFIDVSKNLLEHFWINSLDFDILQTEIELTS